MPLITPWIQGYLMDAGIPHDPFVNFVDPPTRARAANKQMGK
jgi:hypothetical protein